MLFILLMSHVVQPHLIIISNSHNVIIVPVRYTSLLLSLVHMLHLLSYPTNLNTNISGQ